MLRRCARFLHYDCLADVKNKQTDYGHGVF